MPVDPPDMYKHIALLVRAPELTHREFREHWRDRHAPIVREIDGLRRYHRVVPTDPDVAEFDGLAECYFEDLEALTDAFGRPGDPTTEPTDDRAREACEVGRDFLAAEKCRRFVGRELLQRDDVDGDTDGCYKHSAFLVRKAGMSHDAFRAYWQERHTPIAREIEGVVRYATVLPADPGTAAFDGVAELYFEDLEALYDALGGEGSRDYDPDRGAARRAREDVDNFLAIDERPRLIGRERVIVDRGP